jgi:prevent-host-death family protein
MTKVSVKEARQHFSELMDAVERGESIIITRRGRKVAQLKPVRLRSQRRLPDMSKFRTELSLKGEPFSQTVIKQREQDRY